MRHIRNLSKKIRSLFTLFSSVVGGGSGVKPSGKAAAPSPLIKTISGGTLTMTKKISIGKAGVVHVSSPFQSPPAAAPPAKAGGDDARSVSSSASKRQQLLLQLGTTQDSLLGLPPSGSKFARRLCGKKATTEGCSQSQGDLPPSPLICGPNAQSQRNLEYLGKDSSAEKQNAGVGTKRGRGDENIPPVVKNGQTVMNRVNAKTAVEVPQELQNLLRSVSVVQDKDGGEVGTVEEVDGLEEQGRRKKVKGRATKSNEKGEDQAKEVVAVVASRQVRQGESNLIFMPSFLHRSHSTSLNHLTKRRTILLNSFYFSDMK